MTGLRAMLVCALVLAGSARATPESPAQVEAFGVAVQKLPTECRRYAWLPADVRDDILGWNQLLSLAACLQDASITPVEDRDELVAMVDTYARALAIPTVIYIGALEQAPGPVQLRAAYQIAMLHVTLIVRARSSIVAPTDRELHADLEQLIAPSARIAWISFAVIVRATDEDPSLAADPVTQNMVRSARAMLDVLPRPSGEENEEQRLHPVAAQPVADPHEQLASHHER